MSFGIPYTHSINGERYVYYNRLLTDGIHPELGKKAHDVLDFRIEKGASAADLANYFFDLRDGEFNKEIKLLSDKFGMEIANKYNIDDMNENMGIELIKAFNTTLNAKEIFERNLALIKDTSGQKQLITWFPEYFDKEWKNKADDIYNDIIKETLKADEPIEETIERVLNNWIPYLVRSALIYMFDKAETESGIKNNRQELQKAYKSLLDPLMDLQNQMGNDFVQSFIDAYNLKDISQMISEELQKGNRLKSQIDKFTYKDKIQIHSTGGLASENLGNFVGNFVASTVANNFKGTLTGSTGQKADFIFTFDIPTNTISNWLDANDFGTRPENVQAIKALEDRLLKFDDGFIVYTNAKNYTLNKNFKGFSAGTPINLQTWDSMMHAAHIKGRDLIFSIMQLIPGAIGDGCSEEMSRMFARAIASALFDDFDEVGQKIHTGANSIHLLYLDGIYFPLSFYYHLLGKAFYNYNAAEVSDIVKVDFKLPKKIMFPVQYIHEEGSGDESQERWQLNHPNESPWRAQQQYALNNIKVSYHFLRAYDDIMKRLNFEEISS